MNQVKLGEAEALFAVLRQSADADVVAAIEALVRDAPDPALNRVNVLDFAAKRGLDHERVIAAFLHAARVGLERAFPSEPPWRRRGGGGAAGRVFGGRLRGRLGHRPKVKGHGWNFRTSWEIGLGK